MAAVIHMTLAAGAATASFLFLVVVVFDYSTFNGTNHYYRPDDSTNRTATVYVVRHGEKTYGGGCLNIQGQERANHFPQLFNSTNKHNNSEADPNVTAPSPNSTNLYFETPTAIFANNYFNTWGNCERCLLTVMPISQALDNLPIDFSHGFPDKFGGNAAGADAIRNKVAEQQQQLDGENNDNDNPDDVVILVAWEHVNIQFLIAELGVEKDIIPYWKDDDYDTVYVLTLQSYSPETVVSFEVRAQNYVPQSTTCDPTRYVPPPGWNPPQSASTTTTSAEDVDNDDDDGKDEYYNDELYANYFLGVRKEEDDQYKNE